MRQKVLFDTFSYKKKYVYQEGCTHEGINTNLRPAARGRQLRDRAGGQPAGGGETPPHRYGADAGHHGGAHQDGPLRGPYGGAAAGLRAEPAEGGRGPDPGPHGGGEAPGAGDGVGERLPPGGGLPRGLRPLRYGLRRSQGPGGHAPGPPARAGAPPQRLRPPGPRPAALEGGPGGQPQLRQNHAVQRPDGLQPVRGQLARRDGGEKGGPGQAGGPGIHGGGPAGHLLPVPLLYGGAGGPEVHHRGAARRHHRHRGRHQPGAEPVPDHAASGAGASRGAGGELHGRGGEEGGRNRLRPPVRQPGCAGGAHFRPGQREHRRAGPGGPQADAHGADRGARRPVRRLHPRRPPPHQRADPRPGL